MKHHSRSTQDGFSFVELILYISLVTIFIGGAITFSWDIIYGRVKSHVEQEVSQNLRLGLQRILYEIRNASAINSVTTSTLSLANSDAARSPTVFDVSGGRLRVGWGASGSCPSTAPCNLTSNEITVSNLTFTNLSSGSSSLNIRISMTITSAGSRSEYSETQSATASAEVRSL